MHPSIPFAGELLSLGAALAWAIAVFLFRHARAMDPLALNLVKNVLATALFAATMVVLGEGIAWSRSGADWVRLVASGLIGLTLGDTLFFASLRRIGPSVAAITDCTYSPVVVLLSVLLLGEPAPLALLLALPLVGAGLLLVSWQGGEVAPQHRVDRLGVALAMGGVACTALGVILAKPALARSGVVEATAVRLGVGALSLVAVQVLRGEVLSSLRLLEEADLLRAVLLPTLFGTYLSMGLWLGGMKYTAASRAALLNQMATVFLLVITRVVGREVVSPRKWVGAGLALAGAVTVLSG